MAMVYGERWVRDFGPTDDGTWLRRLQGLTPADLDAGVQAIADSGREYPPPLPAFKAICRAAAENRQRRAEEQARPKPPPALEDKRSIETRLAWARPFIQTLRRAVGRPAVEPQPTSETTTTPESSKTTE